MLLWWEWSWHLPVCNIILFSHKVSRGLGAEIDYWNIHVKLCRWIGTALPRCLSTLTAIRKCWTRAPCIMNLALALILRQQILPYHEISCKIGTARLRVDIGREIYIRICFVMFFFFFFIISSLFIHTVYLPACPRTASSTLWQS